MCGIVGAASKRPIVNVLINGLKRLEYRGYDSAGIAVIDEAGRLERLRVVGKVRELESALIAHPVKGHLGIAHTRWATHGVPSEKNAHPFVSHDQFALVHNGIIENHEHLRQKLDKAGYTFTSETDTETVVHLIHYHYKKNKDFLKAVQMTVKELEGAYAFCIFSSACPNRLIGVRQGAPLVIGKGTRENFLASDPLALLTETQQFIYLEDYDIADLTDERINIYDQHGKMVEREIHTILLAQDAIERGEYRHYMKKEIMEQPQAVRSCLDSRLSKDHISPNIFGPKADEIFNKVERITIVACGTSYHAALVGRYWLEGIAHIPCAVEIASEFRYREVAPTANNLFVTISQSGETADSLAALRVARKAHYLSTLVICNVPDSTLTREAGLQFLTRAGVEIGVASTKAFTTQLAALFLLALSLRKERQTKKDLKERELIEQLDDLSASLREVLQQDSAIANWANDFTHKQHALFLGRGIMYPVALEGALKMKEISYIHAEGYPSGELKHGPLALVDVNMPVIAIVPDDHLFEKNLSNLQEVRARGGKLYVLTNEPKAFEGSAFATDTKILPMPTVHPYLNPILYTIPLQLLAYYVAVLKGTDVDQPRNLAKSVTVE